MGMNVGKSSNSNGDPEVMVDINTTPLIDVMLVLLIMLIITIPVQTHAVKLDLPVNQNSTQTEPPPVISIEVDFDGTVYWNGEALPDQQALESKLQQAAQSAKPPEVHIRPNRLAAYKHVASVMASAQRLGIKQLGLIGVK